MHVYITYQCVQSISKKSTPLTVQSALNLGVYTIKLQTSYPYQELDTQTINYTQQVQSRVARPNPSWAWLCTYYIPTDLRYTVRLQKGEVSEATTANYTVNNELCVMTVGPQDKNIMLCTIQNYFQGTIVYTSHLHLRPSHDQVTVCCSGGKTSLFVASVYQELYHMTDTKNDLRPAPTNSI